ncbi:MAG: FtsX-like permease family protein [Balneolales bacterium]
MYLKLSWRNLWRNYRRTLITVTSIVFAVVLALFVGSLNRGTHDQMIDNMSRFHTGFLQVQDPLYEDEPSLDNTLDYDEEVVSEVEGAHPEIEFIVPRIETFMLAASDEQTRGAMVLGIDPQKEQRLNELLDRVTEGSFFEAGDQSVVLSDGLAGRLNLSVGDSLVLLGQGRFGMTASGLYEIEGLVEHPMREMNNQIVYMPLQEAQWLLSAEDYITSLLVTPTEVRHTDNIAASLRQSLDDEGYRVLTWQEMLPDLLGIIQLDNAQQVLMIGILYIVIGFGLFGTVLMMTLERMREFGVLLSIGMKRSQLGMVMFAETLLISALGVLGGCLLGYPIVYYFYRNPIPLGGDMADVVEEMGMGMEAVLMFSIDPDIFWAQGVIIFILAFFICLYPIIKISRLNIIEASRK